MGDPFFEPYTRIFETFIIKILNQKKYFYASFQHLIMWKRTDILV